MPKPTFTQTLRQGILAFGGRRVPTESKRYEIYLAMIPCTKMLTGAGSFKPYHLFLDPSGRTPLKMVPADDGSYRNAHWAPRTLIETFITRGKASQEANEASRKAVA